MSAVHESELQALIEFRGIVKSYGKGASEFKALKGVDFKIQEGEFVAIMGRVVPANRR